MCNTVMLRFIFGLKARALTQEGKLDVYKHANQPKWYSTLPEVGWDDRIQYTYVWVFLCVLFENIRENILGIHLSVPESIVINFSQNAWKHSSTMCIIAMKFCKVSNAWFTYSIHLSPELNASNKSIHNFNIFVYLAKEDCYRSTICTPPENWKSISTGAKFEHYLVGISTSNYAELSSLKVCSPGSFVTMKVSHGLNLTETLGH